MRSVAVFVKGPGAGRESALRALQTAGFKVTLIRDVTPIPHNGCRPPKRAPRSDVERTKTMARYIGPVCKLCRREGISSTSRASAATPRSARHAPSVSAGPARPGRASSSASTPSACARSRRCAASTACSSASSPATTWRRPAARAAPARRCSACIERRLDNVVHRMGFAASRAPRRASSCATATCSSTASASNIPSYVVQPERQDRDSRERAGRSRSSRRRSPRPTSARVPRWLEIDKAELHRHLQGRCRFATSSTSRRFASSYVVEYYSR